MAPKSTSLAKQVHQTSKQEIAVAGNSGKNIENAINYQQSDEFILKSHHINYLKAIDGKLVEGEWKGQPVCQHCDKILGCHKQTWRGKVTVNLKTTNTEFPIKVTWSDGKDPEDYTIAEFQQRCIVLWEPLKECDPPPVIHDSAYRKRGSKSSSKSSSKASNEIQQDPIQKRRKKGKTDEG